MHRYFFTLFLLSNILTATAQDYRYLQILIDTADNFHFVEMEWFDEGVSHPQAMTAYNAPTPLLVTGDNANWNLFRIYDDDFTNSSYVNEVVSSAEFTREFTLDLGAGNSLTPDSVRITKPNYSVLAAFRILLSEDGVNWDLHLDTTRSHIFAETLVFPLNLVIDNEPPSTPQNLTSDCVSAQQIALAWTAATDNYRVTQYHIYQNGTLIDSTQTTRFAVQNLLANTNYSFQVYALDKARNHSTPATISVTTEENDITAPTMNGHLEVIALSANTATIRWAAATDNQAINGYLIQLDGLTIGSTTDTVFSIGGLDTLTTYTVQVVAKDDAQNLSNALKTKFRTLMNNGRTKIGTNFWNQHWSPENNQLFVNGYQNVTGDNPWKPELLAELDYAQTLRYMEMQQINQVAAQPTYRWLDRKKKNNVLQDEIAYEWMIDLCNRKNANLWVCLPNQIISRNGVSRGRENYIKKLAILLKTGIDMGDVDLDQAVFDDLTQFTPKDFLLHGGQLVCAPLQSHLKIYIEYGNENWNSTFAQTTYCATEGQIMGFGWGPQSAGRVFSGYASLKLFEEFAAVFGKDNPRIEDILPIQGHGIFYTNYTFEEVFDDPVLNPHNLMPDHISGETYFANGEDGAAANIEQILHAEIAEMTQEVREMRAYLDEEGTQRNWHFGLVSYEGGHHITTNYEAINTNPIIYDAYLNFLDSTNLFFEEVLLFSHVGYNAFGLKQYVDQPMEEAHKYRAVVDWLPHSVADSTFCQATFLAINVDTIPSSLFKAADSLQMVGVVPSGTATSVIASESITLTDGFSVAFGGTFSAQIADCALSPLPNLLPAVVESRTNTLLSTPYFDHNIQLTIAPNPVRYEVNLQFYLPKLSNVVLQIFNANGQSVETWQCHVSTAGWHQSRLSVAQLPAGIYYVNLSTAHGTITQKIMVNLF